MSEGIHITGWTRIAGNTIVINDKKQAGEENFPNFAAFIKAFYKKEQLSYPKFYKMDNLSKLGFLSAELLIKNSDVLKRYGSGEIGVVLANSSSSLDTDLDYQELIKDKSNYFPSPSVFVYTLPNIMIGEICIRHKINGENAFFICEEFDLGLIRNYVNHLFKQGRVNACICGWIELLREQYHSFMLLVERMPGTLPDDMNDHGIFSIENLDKIYNIKV